MRDAANKQTKNKRIILNLHLQACQIAHELQLHDEFNIFEFLFPLILQDKISTAEMYLEQARGLQRPLIELLDSLLDRSSSVQNICEHYAE